MDVECFRLQVPHHARVAGFTAKGQWVPVVPGEHLVHRVKPKVPLRGIAESLRFVGADEFGCDVHVPIPPESTIESVLHALTHEAA